MSHLNFRQLHFKGETVVGFTRRVLRRIGPEVCTDASNRVPKYITLAGSSREVKISAKLLDNVQIKDPERT